MPEPACVRPAAGGVADPAKECYGAVTLKVLSRQGRWVRVLVCGLSGLPWVGGSGGLMLEVNIEPGGRPRWLVLPHAHGPNVNVKLEAVVKQPREIKTKKKFLVKVGVWVCGRVWRHAALGHALTPLREPGNPVTAQLLHHTQLTEDLGLVEVSLRCDYSDNLMKQVVGTSMAEVILTLEVLRAKNLRPFNPGLLSKAKHSKKKEHAEVVCRVGLWVKGERVERKSSTSVKLPVTHDPVIRNRSVFNIPRDHLQNAALIVKVLYTSKWAGEDTVGRVKLGPLLYLGTSPDQASVNPQPDYNTSITLSHWGQALKTPGPVTMWHHLQL
ncbi:Synaptotagmin-17 [Penaeus vannamei]|uniref:Synaptotagmin-17 n=2 Tax=Penaeus vannamei TaxID=6689 RepID=A0A423U5R2_PENVA|nr:Synaptotagmin-17 [Penaeus vannamei]